jgi:AraC-like DNA-binding protein
VTGYSPNEYIRIIRMKKAVELPQTDEFTVCVSILAMHDNPGTKTMNCPAGHLYQ